MTKKRGRPKKLPSLQMKEFDRQFREACIPAFLVDRELTVLYANEYARTAFPEADQPEGLRALLPENSREECVQRIAKRECFRLPLPFLNGVPATIAVTPVAEEEDDQAAGAMVLVTCSDRPGEQTASGDSVTAISNSLRQPISDIFGALGLMGRKAHIINRDTQYDSYLQSINLASYQLLRNVINLVSYQRSCSGCRGLVEVVDFWARISPLLDACDIVLHDNEIPFRFELPDKHQVAHVSCCFEEVEDALMNLISNAYCYSRPGNRVEVIGKNSSNGVMLTVSDCGRGIESDRMEKIFSPFYSYGQNEGAFAGMGLGLTVARQNIEANGGRLAVDSIAGKGTSVIFTLPICDKPLTPPLVMNSSAAQYLRNHFSHMYIGLCNVATLPPQ